MTKRLSSGDTGGDTCRIGVPAEVQRAAQRQSEIEEESPHHSTLDPMGTIRAEGQFLRKAASGRSWPGWIIAASCFFVGLPAAALLTTAVVSAFVRAHVPLVERVQGMFFACVFLGIPLLIVINMTRNWLQQHWLQQQRKER